MSLEAVRRAPRHASPRCRSGPGRVDPQPLAGGITNQNFVVEDRGRRYVVRVGDDILVHGVVRANELAASRAAHAAGSEPRRACTPSPACWSSTSSRAAPSRRRTCATRRISSASSTWCGAATATFRTILRGPGADVLGVPRRARLRPHAARRQQPPCWPCCPTCWRGRRVSKRPSGRSTSCSATTICLPANFIDDGKRLWLVDWEYAGFNSPLFDLGGLASNSELPPEQAEALLEPLFRRAGRRRACAAAPPP